MKSKQQPAKTSTGSTSARFTDEERAAMRERAREMRARPGAPEAGRESEVLAKIAEMPKADRALGELLHAITTSSAPGIAPTTWYGMPAYAKAGTVICHFQPAQKFKTRYATLGFSDKANLDEGAMWPVAFALKELTAVDETRIRALVKRAVS
jgi:uncharacterized protein YdhG (YjbR/CyaY superfamily)